MVPDDLLRQAIFGLDLELSRVAWSTLARTDSPDSVDLIADALRMQMDGNERAGFAATIDRLGEASPEVRTPAVAHNGLGGS